MKHYGDITKLNGKELPIVDVITGGSPCQDLSVAGKRAGLAGERSGLFMEQIRVIKEMRERDRADGRTDEHIRPRYMVWENVPGAFSSNGGEDFRAVLEETARVADKDAVIPGLAGKQKWTPSGAIVGDGWSIAWRVHDAQFWGVPQRRKRISLVADFGGQSAPEILFERESLSGDSSQSGEERKTVAGDAEERTGETSGRVLNPQSYTLKIRGGVDVDSNGKKAGKGPLVQTELSGTLGVSQDQTLFAKPIGFNRERCGAITMDDAMPTLQAAAGESGNNQPMVVTPQCEQDVLSFDPSFSKNYSGTYFENIAKTIQPGTAPGFHDAVAYRKTAHTQNAEEGQGWEETSTSDTLNVYDNSETRTPTVVVTNEPICLESNQNHAGVCNDGISYALPASAGMGGGYVPMIVDEQAPSAYGLEPWAAQRLNTESRFLEECAPTLRAHMGDNQASVAYSIDKAITTKAESSTAGGSCVHCEYTSPLTTDRPHAVAYGIDQQGGKGGANYAEDVMPTIASDSHGTPHAVCYGISPYTSHAMLSDNPHSGIYVAETARTLDLNGGSPACNQGGMAVVQGAKVISYGLDGYNQTIDEETAQPLRSADGGDTTPKVVCLEGNDSHPSHREDGYSESETMYTLNGTERHAVFDARGNGNGNVAPTITGDHENRITDYTAVVYDASRRHNYEPFGEICETVQACYGTGGNNMPIVLDADRTNDVCGFDAYNQTATGDVSMSLTAKAPDAHHIPTACISIDEKMGNTYIGEDIGNTLGARDYKQPQAVAMEKTYQEVTGSLMASGYDKLGTQEAMNDMFVVSNSHATDDMAESMEVFHCQSAENKVHTLRARDYKDPQIVTHARATHIVRRLTPLECERLQGFPDGWTDIGDWVDSKGKTHKGDADSPRYKALGNSIALPFWQWMAKRMVGFIDHKPTMASLFDGIGGFPLAFSRCGCDPLWASEIEEFPIAVTKIHFPEKE